MAKRSKGSNTLTNKLLGSSLPHSAVVQVLRDDGGQSLRQEALGLRSQALKITLTTGSRRHVRVCGRAGVFVRSSHFAWGGVFLCSADYSPEDQRQERVFSWFVLHSTDASLLNDCFLPVEKYCCTIW